MTLRALGHAYKGLCKDTKRNTIMHTHQMIVSIHIVQATDTPAGGPTPSMFTCRSPPEVTRGIRVTKHKAGAGNYVTTACYALQDTLLEQKVHSKKIPKALLPPGSQLTLLELPVFPRERLSENDAHNDRQSERGDANRVGFGVGESP